MTDKQILETLDEMEAYWIQCYAGASVGGKAERRFARYANCIGELKTMIRQRKAAEKEEKTHDK